MRRRYSPALLALLLAGCGGSSASPAAPTAPAPAPPGVTVSGRVTATNGGQALAGVVVQTAGGQSLTDAAGDYSLALAPPAAATLQLSADGIVPRSLTVAATSSRAVALTAIARTAPFDLDYYRALVRGRLERPTLQPLRRWTTAPQVYLRTVDDAGAPIDARTLDTTDRTIRDAIPTWTAGAFPATITRGADSRAGVHGWITVRWPSATDRGICGEAEIAVDGGTVDLYYRTGGGCRCAGLSEIAPRSVRHEIGHALGFWHTDDPADVMAPGMPGCDVPISARERYHAAIAYQRPVGNQDPDADPATAIALAPARVP